MSHKEVDLDQQLAEVVRVYDANLAMKIALTDKQEEIREYEDRLSDKKLHISQRINFTQELSNAQKMLTIYEESYDSGVNFTQQFSILVDALRNAGPNEIDKAKQMVEVLRNQLSDKFAARQKTINNLSQTSIADFHQQYQDQMQILSQLSADLEQKAELQKSEPVDLVERVEASMEVLKKFEALIDALGDSVKLSSADSAAFDDVRNKAEAVLHEANETKNPNELLKIELSELLNIIQIKVDIVRERIANTSQDLSAQLPALQAQLTQLVEADQINQSAQKSAEASGSISENNRDLVKTLETIGTAMKSFFTDTIPNLLDLIKVRIDAKQSTRLSVQHETGKAWVAKGESSVRASDGQQKTIDPDSASPAKKQ